MKKMKKTTLFIISLLMSSFLFCQTQNSLIIKFKTTNKPNRIFVQNQQKFQNSKIDILNTNNGLKSIILTGNKKMEDTYVINLDSDKQIEELIELYRLTDLFEYVEPNFVGHGHGYSQTTPNDTFFNRQWSHYNDGTFSLSNSTVDADIDSELAWDITQGNSNLIIAILDSGLKLDHPEFAGRIWTNPSEVQDGSDTDSNGFIDDINGGWDFVNNDNNPTDDHGHGTNVAGIAVASGNNSNGYAGVNWNSKIMVCKILDDNNSGFYSWWADAIYYAVDNGASVINLSAGGNGSSTLLENAINYAYNNNVVIVVSTGNQNSVIQYPARYTNAFAVGSTDSDDTRSAPFFWSSTSGSNFGPELDFVAPGNYIYGLSYSSNTNFNTYWGGTSQAAPHVAGLVSLLLSVDSNLTVDQIRTILEESSEDQVGDSDDTIGWDQYYGHGRINAYNALTHSTLSINDIDVLNDNIVLYPNPTSNNNLLRVRGIDNGIHEINIYNNLGQLINKNEITVDNSIVSILIENLKSGLYYINIKNKLNNAIVMKKLIIK
jgi:subtilisin family serine protease